MRDWERHRDREIEREKGGVSGREAECEREKE